MKSVTINVKPIKISFADVIRNAMEVAIKTDHTEGLCSLMISHQERILFKKCIREILPNWEYFSGNTVFPVEGNGSCYHGYDSKWIAGFGFGDKRIGMCEFIISSLESTHTHLNNKIETMVNLR